MRNLVESRFQTYSSLRIWTNYRTKKTEGLPGAMLLIWAVCKHHISLLLFNSKAYLALQWSAENLISLPRLNVSNLLVTISGCHCIRPNFVRVLHIWSSVPNILRIHPHCWSSSGAVPFGAYSICQVLPSPQMLQPSLKILEFQHTNSNPSAMFRYFRTYQLGPDPDLS